MWGAADYISWSNYIPRVIIEFEFLVHSVSTTFYNGTPKLKRHVHSQTYKYSETCLKLTSIERNPVFSGNPSQSRVSVT